MRGRVYVLIGAIILLGLVAAALFLFQDGDEGDDAGTDQVQDADNGDAVSQPTQAPDGTTDGPPTAEPIDEVLFEEIVVAVQFLPRGRLIEGDNPGVMVQPWPRQALPEQGQYILAEDLEKDVIGKIARTDIFRGQPILRDHLVDDLGEIAKRGSDAAAIMANIDIPNVNTDSWVAVALPLDLSGVGQIAYGIQDGDYVDVLLSFLFVDVDPTFQTRLPNTFSIITTMETGALSIGAPRQGRLETVSDLSVDGVVLGPSEASQRPRLVTQRVVTDAFVVHVGYFPEGGRFIGPTPTPMEIEPPPAALAEDDEDITPEPTATAYMPQIITLGVSPQDALVLAWAVDAQIPITLALRQVGDHTPPELNPTEPVTLEYMMRAFPNQQPPEPLGYALEPPITSVRRFDIGTMYGFLGEIFGAGDGDE
jgi:Flp pilus assembly protein CpaB